MLTKVNICIVHIYSVIDLILWTNKMNYMNKMIIVLIVWLLFISDEIPVYFGIHDQSIHPISSK